MKTPAFPKTIGNRGAAAYAPENTLAGIHAAADMGVEMVMLSVKLTRDGTAVLFHDDDLIRTTGAGAHMAETDAATVAELDAGSWFGDSFIGEGVPLLEDALDAALERGLAVALDLRPCAGREVETAEAALDAATRIWPEDTAPPVLASASHVTLETCRDMLPEWPRALILEKPAENWAEMADYIAAAAIFIDNAGITRDEAEEVIEAQKPVIVIGVNDPHHAQELMRWGIDAVVTDAPDTLREAVERFH